MCWQSGQGRTMLHVISHGFVPAFRQLELGNVRLLHSTVLKALCGIKEYSNQSSVR